MPQLLYQKDLRAAQSLHFCYICGKPFAKGDLVSKDHVPPKSIFLQKDRQPLILPAHRTCNEGWSSIDERIGQLIGIQTGRFPREAKKRRLNIVTMGSLRWGGITGVNLERAVWRWIAGFHAALYKEPLVNFWPYIALPFSRLDLIQDVYQPAPTYDAQHLMCVNMIKENRAKGTIDIVNANFDNIRYECVWSRSDDNKTWICFFALKIYDWSRLGHTPLSRKQGCVGLYILREGEVPVSATQASKLSVRLTNLYPLDPFAR